MTRKKKLPLATILEPETALLRAMISAILDAADERVCGGVTLARDEDGEYYVVQYADDQAPLRVVK